MITALMSTYIRLFREKAEARDLKLIEEKTEKFEKYKETCRQADQIIVKNRIEAVAARMISKKAKIVMLGKGKVDI